jgi:hypothetical protein
MTKAIAKTYDTINENMMKMTYVMLAACLLLVLIYVVNIFSVISKTVALQRVESQITAISSSVDNLDSQYLNLSGRITPDNLSAYGMTQGKVSAYIARSNGVELGFATNLNHVALGTHEF